MDLEEPVEQGPDPNDDWAEDEGGSGDLQNDEDYL